MVSVACIRSSFPGRNPFPLLYSKKNAVGFFVSRARKSRVVTVNPESFNGLAARKFSLKVFVFERLVPRERDLCL